MRLKNSNKQILILKMKKCTFLAKLYFKMAADKGDKTAMCNYGNMLRDGIGVDKDEPEACKYYKMAADKGHVEAMNNYGCMLHDGIGIKIDKGDVETKKNYASLLKDCTKAIKNETKSRLLNSRKRNRRCKE